MPHSVKYTFKTFCTNRHPTIFLHIKIGSQFHSFTFKCIGCTRYCKSCHLRWCGNSILRSSFIIPFSVVSIRLIVVTTTICPVCQIFGIICINALKSTKKDRHNNKKESFAIHILSLLIKTLQSNNSFHFPTRSISTKIYPITKVNSPFIL